MKYLGLMHYFLGLEVWQHADEIFLRQRRYTVDILRRLGMTDCKSMATSMTMNLKKLNVDVAGSDVIDPTMYQQLVGSLMYLVNTRPDICFAMSTLGQFMCEPRQMHWVATKHVLRYVRDTIGYGLRYTSSSDMSLVNYSDSDWAGSVEDRKSTYGCCFGLGYVVVSWFSRKQHSIALSTAEVEYIAACMLACEAVWLQKLPASLFGQRLEPTLIHCDNQSCVKLSVIPIHHDRTKHVEMKYHYVREMVQRCAVELWYIPIEEQITDALTKSLCRGKFECFQDKLRVVENVSLAEREC